MPWIDKTQNGREKTLRGRSLDTYFEWPLVSYVEWKRPRSVELSSLRIHKTIHYRQQLTLLSIHIFSDRRNLQIVIPHRIFRLRTQLLPTTMTDTSDDKPTECPLAKKMRFAEPDLEVIVKFTKDGTVAEKTYHMYSQILARHSEFFDAALSAEMQEKRTRKITLECSCTLVFEQAILIVEDLAAARKITPHDVLALAEFYDQYGFTGAKQLCDSVLAEYYESIGENYPEDLDLCMFGIKVARNYNLSQALQAGVNYVKGDVEASPHDPFGYLPLTEEHIGLLLPLYKENVLTLPSCLSMEDIDNPLFVKHYEKCRSNHFWNRFLTGLVLRSRAFQISFNKFQLGRFEGRYSFGHVRGSSPTAEFCLKKGEVDGDWVMCSDPDVWFKCPGSSHLDYPPPGPWCPVYHLVTGKRPMLYYGLF
jgi:hypothetical protein